jgi:hypothetical protein
MKLSPGSNVLVLATIKVVEDASTGWALNVNAQKIIKSSVKAILDTVLFSNLHSLSYQFIVIERPKIYSLLNIFVAPFSTIFSLFSSKLLFNPIKGSILGMRRPFKVPLLNFFLSYSVSNV